VNLAKQAANSSTPTTCTAYHHFVESGEVCLLNLAGNVPSFGVSSLETMNIRRRRGNVRISLFLHGAITAAALKARNAAFPGTLN
jgi:hypothetical protein